MNNIKQFFFSTLILLAVSASHCHAQSYSGCVTDAGGKPIEFVNVLLVNAADSSYIAGDVTDADGRFAITVKEEGSNKDILLKASCIGYNTAFAKYGQNPVTIILSEAVNSTGEVVVKSKAPTFSLSNEGIITNVAGTLLARLGTGVDVLKRIPGVISTGSGYEVFGKGTPLIYINGRRIINSSEIEELKAENIKSIEVITSPGAKYSSQVNSVIKIKTKKPVGEGLSISLRSPYWQGYYTRFNEQLSWNYRHKKLDVFGIHRYVNSRSHSTTDITLQTESDTLWFHRMREVSSEKDTGWYNCAGMSYQLNDSTSFGSRYVTWLYPDDNYGDVSSTTETTANGKKFDSFKRQGHVVADRSPYQYANFYFRGKTGGVSLGFDFDYLHSKSESTSTSTEISQNDESRNINTYNKVYSNMYAAKLTADFHALAADVSVGSEFTSSKRNNIYNNTEGYISNSESSIREMNLSPFVEMYWKLPEGSRLSAGLRYERVWSDYEEEGKHIGEQSRYYGNFFPSISYSKAIGQLQLRLSYSEKNRRPTYNQLRSNMYYGNRFIYQSGNPNLKQELRHNLSLNAVWNFLQFRVDYTDRRNAIIYSSDMYQGSNSITYISFENKKSLKSVSFMASASPTIGMWSPYLTAGLNKQWFNRKTKTGTKDMSSPYASFSLTNMFDLGHEWTAEIDLSYVTKGYDENVYLSRNNFTANISMRKRFFKRQLSVEAGIYDIFRQKRGTDLFFYQIKTTQLEKSDSRFLYICLSYNFNATKSKYKGTGAGNNERNRL